MLKANKAKLYEAAKSLYKLRTGTALISDKNKALFKCEASVRQVISDEANDLQPQVRRLEGFLGYVATQTSELSNGGFSYRKMNILDGKIKKFMYRYVKPGEYETDDSPAVALLKDVLVHIRKIKGHVPASIPVDRHLTPANIVDVLDKTITEFLSNVPGGWLAEPTEPVKKDAPRPHSLYQVKSVIELLEHERGFANSDPRGNLAACALRLNEVISDIYGGAAQPVIHSSIDKCREALDNAYRMLCNLADGKIGSSDLTKAKVYAEQASDWLSDAIKGVDESPAGPKANPYRRVVLDHAREFTYISGLRDMDYIRKYSRESADWLKQFLANLEEDKPVEQKPWTTNGEMQGMNLPPGFSGPFVDLHVPGGAAQPITGIAEYRDFLLEIQANASDIKRHLRTASPIAASTLAAGILNKIEKFLNDRVPVASSVNQSEPKWEDPYPYLLTDKVIDNMCIVSRLASPFPIATDMIKWLDSIKAKRKSDREKLSKVCPLHFEMPTPSQVASQRPDYVKLPDNKTHACETGETHIGHRCSPKDIVADFMDGVREQCENRIHRSPVDIPFITQDMLETAKKFEPAYEGDSNPAKNGDDLLKNYGGLPPILRPGGGEGGKHDPVATGSTGKPQTWEELVEHATGEPNPPDHVMPSPATKTEPPSRKCEKCQIGLTGINLLQSWCSQCGRIEQLGCSPLIPAKQETEVIRCWGCNTDMRYTKAGGFVGAGPCVKTAIRGVTVRIAPCGKCGLPAAIEVVTGGNTVLLSRTRQGVSQ